VPKASNGSTIDALRKRGVTRATFHPDGRLASFELGPLPPVVQMVTRGKAGTVTRIVPVEAAPSPKEERTDLDALGMTMPAFDRDSP
jgi:hypothetical protein